MLLSIPQRCNVRLLCLYVHVDALSMILPFPKCNSKNWFMHHRARLLVNVGFRFKVLKVFFFLKCLIPQKFFLSCMVGNFSDILHLEAFFKCISQTYLIVLQINQRSILEAHDFQFLTIFFSYTCFDCFFFWLVIWL